jgi:hypothetical protein
MGLHGFLQGSFYFYLGYRHVRPLMFLHDELNKKEIRRELVECEWHLWAATVSLNSLVRFTLAHEQIYKHLSSPLTMKIRLNYVYINHEDVVDLCIFYSSAHFLCSVYVLQACCSGKLLFQKHLKNKWIFSYVYILLIIPSSLNVIGISLVLWSSPWSSPHYPDHINPMERSSCEGNSRPVSREIRHLLCGSKADYFVQKCLYFSLSCARRI